MLNKEPLNLVHYLSALIFLLIYLVKTTQLLLNKTEGLKKTTKVLRIPEMIISTAFLVTGIWLLIKVPQIHYLHIIKIGMVFISIPLAIIGFKRSNKALAAISLLLIIGAFGLGEMSARKKSNVSDVKIAAGAEGKEIYENACVRCHGNDGKAGMMGATDLTASSIPTDSAVVVIENGRGQMPGFKEQLSAEQIQKVAEYSASLRGK